MIHVVHDLRFFFTLNSTEHEISTAHKIKMLKNKDFSSFEILRYCIYHSNKCLNAKLLAF